MRRTKPPKIQKNKSDININTIDSLTAPIKEAHFIQEYIHTLDLEQAAVNAGVINPDAPKSQKQKAIQDILYRVREHLNDIIQNRIHRLQITDDKIILELANIAFADPGTVFREDGTIVPLHEMPPETRRCIQDITFFRKSKEEEEREQNGEVVHPNIKDIKMYDKQSALQTLLKHLTGNLNSNVNINNTFNQIGQQNNLNIQQNNVDLNDFSDEELKVLRKMIGDEDPYEILNLEEIEKTYA